MWWTVMNHIFIKVFYRVKLFNVSILMCTFGSVQLLPENSAWIYEMLAKTLKKLTKYKSKRCNIKSRRRIFHSSNVLQFLLKLIMEALLWFHISETKWVKNWIQWSLHIENCRDATQKRSRLQSFDVLSFIELIVNCWCCIYQIQKVYV